MCVCDDVCADVHRSGGTRPSVLLWNNITSITEAKRSIQRETKTDGSRQSESSAKEREVHFNQGFGPLSCHANMRVCPGGWHNFADGFDPLSVVTWLASWATSRDCCGAANCDQKKRLGYSACACAGGVTWLLLLLNKVVLSAVAVSHTVILSSLCIHYVWVWLMGLINGFFLWSPLVQLEK